MFEDNYRAANNSLNPSAEAEKRVLAAMRGEGEVNNATPVRRPRRGLTAVIAAALCVLFVAPAIIGITKLAGKHNAGSRSSAVQPGVLAVTLPSHAEEGSSADDYSAVFERLSCSLRPYSGSRSGSIGFLDGIFKFFGGLKADDMILEDAEAPSAAEPNSYGNPSQILDQDGRSNTSGAEEPGEGSDYSKTNTQVEGVDEADVIKTDGRYIYVLNNSGVTVLEAKGADTEKLAFIPAEDMPKHHDDAVTDPFEMYVIDGRLIVLANECVYSEVFYDLPNVDLDSDDCLCYGGLRIAGSMLTTVYVYDVTNASEPELISTVCQDGGYRDSRLTGGILYVVTSYTPCGPVFEEEPATYVPCNYNSDGECRLTASGDIHITNEEDTDACYTYVCALDVKNPSEFGGTLALLGNTGTLYCSTDNLYLSCYRFKDEHRDITFDVDVNEQAKESSTGSLHGVLYSGGYYTDIYRIAIGGIQPVLAATGSFEGELLNQFSLDEYNGHLRVAVNRDGWSYIEVPINGNADMYGAYYYDFNDENQTDNAVFVLDMGLNVVGKLEGLGKDEYIKSVRFMGDTAYVVTFRQTDPLFSIDLKDPNAPKVLGELKIPGFSEYLHPWGDGMLLGLGQQADIQSGGTEGLKLSMFDISDKTDVKELYCKKADGVYYSEAEYNHKAILAAPDRGLIGFPADWESYQLYTFDEAEGFVKKGEINLNPDEDSFRYGSDMRGLYIGDYFYIIDRDVCGVYVIDLNTFMLAGSLSFN